MGESLGSFNLPPSPPSSNSDSDTFMSEEASKRIAVAGSSIKSSQVSSNRQIRKGKKADSKVMNMNKRLSDQPNENRIAKKAKSDAPSIALKTGVTPRPNQADDNQSSQSSESEEEDEEYEVEDIIDYWVEGGKQQYLIKWSGWADEHNTWETKGNLNNCDVLMKDFFFKRVSEIKLCKETNKNDPKVLNATLKKLPLPPDPRSMQEKVEYFFRTTLSPPVSNEDLEKAFKAQDPEKRTAPKSTKKVLDKKLSDSVLGNLKSGELDELKEELLPLMLDYRREEVKKSLLEWEKKLNEITKGKPNLKVVNNVDLTGPPADFQYVNDYVPGRGVVIPNDPLMGCECEGSCLKNKKTCCPNNNEAIFAYSAHKRVNVAPGTPIYECNRYCKCDMTCPNRVVQDGVVSLKGAHFLIFRTDNGKGWGVKTLKPIKKGEFVAIYAGEVITTTEADERGKGYDRDGLTYLFDLDINETEEEECKYVVDAKKMGNFSHFFNHSCDPNLRVYNVFVDCIDRDIPKLALFASRDISKGEELHFDYMNRMEGDGEPNTKDKNVYRCVCGADNCRKFFL